MSITLADSNTSIAAPSYDAPAFGVDAAAADRAYVISARNALLNIGPGAR